MVHKVRSAKTPEQRRAEAEALHETIATEIEKLRDSTNWTRFLDFSRHMQRYSLGNLLLIMAQNPEATAVAGYRAWQDRGYQVRRGETAMRIFGGRSITETVEDPTTGDEEEKRRTLFFAVPVFDISQCDPIDPADAVTPVVTTRLTGEDPAGIYEAVADYLTSQGWAVIREPIPGETNGYTTMDGSRRIVIDSRLSPAQAAKTALHEAAHALLHASDAAGEYDAHRGIKETEAESVAYVTAGMLGLDTAEYSIGYVAGWSDCDPQVIKDTATNVLRCAQILTDALTTTDAEGLDATGPVSGLDVDAAQAVVEASITRPGVVTRTADSPAGPITPPDPSSPGLPTTIDDAAEALLAHLPRYAGDLMRAIVYLGAHREWESESVEALAGPIQRAVLDAGLPPFGSTGPCGEYHAYYGALAHTAGIDTDWAPRWPDASPDPERRSGPYLRL